MSTVVLSPVGPARALAIQLCRALTGSPPEVVMDPLDVEGAWLAADLLVVGTPVDDGEVDPGVARALGALRGPDLGAVVVVSCGRWPAEAATAERRLGHVLGGLGARLVLPTLHADRGHDAVLDDFARHWRAVVTGPALGSAA